MQMAIRPSVTSALDQTGTSATEKKLQKRFGDGLILEYEDE